MNSNELQRLLRATPGFFLLLRPDADFTIVAASDDYLRATHTDAGIFGRPLFEVFPGNPDGAGADGMKHLGDSLRRVVATRSADTMPVQRYDVRLPQARGGAFEERYWAPVNSPVPGEDGQLEYILHCVEDAMARRNRDAAQQADRERLINESEKQRRIYETALNSTPDFVYVFDVDHRALYANDALLKTWGVADVRGKKWMDLGYEQWHADMHDAEIDRVIATRAPIRGEIPFTGTNGRRIYDYIFAPVLGPDGEVVAVAGTTRDITDRQAAEQAIREQAGRLAESDRAKDEFLATLSHELRNPLAPLRNSIAVLQSSPDPAKSQPVLAMMERQVNHLVRLVDDLLEVSRISRGTFSLRVERVDLASVIRNAVEASQPLVHAGRHTLEVELPPEPLWLEGDAVRLAQILSNLLNNAATYTEEGGRITVRAWREDGHAAIGVRDTGVGMAPESVQRMFEMFSRGDRDSARTSAGQPLSHTRVLVVDDNHDAGDSLAMILEMLGAQVQVARGGAEAIEAFPGYQPTAVLLDIGMPGMNGYEVARALRSRFPEQRAVLVALTGWGQDDDRKRAREAGFDHHLVKPAEIDALQQLLASIQAAPA
ncbi:MAG: response regulator [Comamonadaceae bacterium]|nr:MAG: response regulator [Comamonadaceae bacterium]